MSQIPPQPPEHDGKSTKPTSDDGPDVSEPGEPDVHIPGEPEVVTPSPNTPELGSTGSAPGSPADRTRGREIRDEIKKLVEEWNGYQESKKSFGFPDKLGPPKNPAPGFRLEPDGCVGFGASGAVWRAHKEGEQEDQVPVALKFFRKFGGVIDLRTDVRILKKLTDEPGLFIRLRAVYVGGEYPYPFIEMDFAEQSLAERIKDRGPLPVAEAVRVFRQIVVAMAHAHAKGVCHCDLKPGNVLLTAKVAGDARVSDFGKSRLATDKIATAILGTYGYMPPEQASLGNELPDARWDVYALGATFYHMVNPAKAPPRSEGWSKSLLTIEKKDPAVRLKRYGDYLKDAPPPVAHRKARGMDRKLAAIITRCLALDPAQRYRNAGEVLDALGRRTQDRKRSPILWLGTAATVACVAVAGLVASDARLTIVKEQKKKQQKQILEAHADTAHLAATVLHDKLRRRVNFLDRAVPGPGDLGQPLQAGAIDPRAARDALVAGLHKLKTAHSVPLSPRSLVWLSDARADVDKWVAALSGQAEREKLFIVSGEEASNGLESGLAVTIHADGQGYVFSETEKQRDGQWGPSSPWKDDETLKAYSKNYAHRDWFGGSGYSYEGREPPKSLSPVADTHISVVFQGTDAVGKNKERPFYLNVTRPIYAEVVPGRPPEVVGVLYGSISVRRELTEWIQEADATPGSQPADAGTAPDGPGWFGRHWPWAVSSAAKPKREGQLLLVLDDRGHLVWRPEFKDYLKEPVRDSSMLIEVCSLYQNSTKKGPRWDAFLADPDGGPAAGEVEKWTGTFTDPGWAAARALARKADAPAAGPAPKYLAAYEQFFPLGTGTRPWTVLVIQQSDEALAAVIDLDRNLSAEVAKAFGVFGAVAAAVWLGVVWALRRSEGATDG
jgi:hypothetical protein